MNELIAHEKKSIRNEDLFRFIEISEEFTIIVIVQNAKVLFADILEFILFNAAHCSTTVYRWLLMCIAL